ncbi:ClpXP protease specificity-enhancing factor [Orrella daihaiensis]|uniref:ClpXP protease specificity-enhancing factor n=1 Tax=Orrella daihaiensis TaxID=2782176 RepID=A0ABY4ARF7_9BURK|nr:ClpXP protease specificity-enhancing factor [Orrella daihaiensis]UOD50629.1 ClpXP protease specificity-enhancing factor [Orrella daihaiensis]
MPETSTKPYFLRALYEWATDNGYTPHIVVQVNNACRVPAAFVQDGQITLNIGHLATGGLVIGNELIEFQARFGGKAEHISVPVAAVTAIYARETGTGMGFEVDETTTSETVLETDGNLQASVQDADSPEQIGTDEKSKRPSLRIVK